MLEDAVADLRVQKGRRRAEDRDRTPNIVLGLPVLIPDTYVPELPVRSGLYHRIGAFGSDADTGAMAAGLVAWIGCRNRHARPFWSGPAAFGPGRLMLLNAR